MKRLLIIIIFIASSNICPSAILLKYVPSEVKTVLIDEVVIVSTKLEKPKYPRSIITDSIFEKQLYVESGCKHFVKGHDGELKLIKSPQGAVGIAQFLPSTWEWLKSTKVLPANFSIENESHQRAAQRIFMNQLIKKDYGINYDKVKLALASYNAGSGRVKSLIKKYGLNWENHLPKETKKYIKIITS